MRTDLRKGVSKLYSISRSQPAIAGFKDEEALSCMSCLYILKINHLSVASFAIIFSHSEGCLLILFIVSLVNFRIN